MIQLHTQIKHLRHDIVNYSNIISTTSKDSSHYLQLRNDILSITSELREKINIMLPPPSLQINAFSAYENYVLWSSVNEILTLYNIEFKELNTIHTQENGKEYLTLHFPDINNKLNRIVKQSYSIQMIDFLAKNHNGSADFKKEETWILRISI